MLSPAPKNKKNSVKLEKEALKQSSSSLPHTHSQFLLPLSEALVIGMIVFLGAEGTSLLTWVKMGLENMLSILKLSAIGKEGG